MDELHHFTVKLVWKTQEGDATRMFSVNMKLQPPKGPTVLTHQSVFVMAFH